jgi:hypothetical protein
MEQEEIEHFDHSITAYYTTHVPSPMSPLPMPSTTAITATATTTTTMAHHHHHPQQQQQQQQQQRFTPNFSLDTESGTTPYYYGYTIQNHGGYNLRTIYFRENNYYSSYMVAPSILSPVMNQYDCVDMRPATSVSVNANVNASNNHMKLSNMSNKTLNDCYSSEKKSMEKINRESQRHFHKLFAQLPDEILCNIFSFLGSDVSVSQIELDTCIDFKTAYRLSNDNFQQLLRITNQFNRDLFSLSQVSRRWRAIVFHPKNEQCIWHRSEMCGYFFFNVTRLLAEASAAQPIIKDIEPIMKVRQYYRHVLKAGIKYSWQLDIAEEKDETLINERNNLINYLAYDISYSSYLLQLREAIYLTWKRRLKIDHRSQVGRKMDPVILNLFSTLPFLLLNVWLLSIALMNTVPFLIVSWPFWFVSFSILYLTILSLFVLVTLQTVREWLRGYLGWSDRFLTFLISSLLLAVLIFSIFLNFNTIYVFSSEKLKILPSELTNGWVVCSPMFLWVILAVSVSEVYILSRYVNYKWSKAQCIIGWSGLLLFLAGIIIAFLVLLAIKLNSRMDQSLNWAFIYIPWNILEALALIVGFVYCVMHARKNREKGMVASARIAQATILYGALLFVVGMLLIHQVFMSVNMLRPYSAIPIFIITILIHIYIILVNYCKKIIEEYWFL